MLERQSGLQGKQLLKQQGTCRPARRTLHRLTCGHATRRGHLRGQHIHGAPQRLPGGCSARAPAEHALVAASPETQSRQDSGSCIPVLGTQGCLLLLNRHSTHRQLFYEEATPPCNSTDGDLIIWTTGKGPIVGAHDVTGEQPRPSQQVQIAAAVSHKRLHCL